MAAAPRFSISEASRRQALASTDAPRISAKSPSCRRSAEKSDAVTRTQAGRGRCHSCRGTGRREPYGIVRTAKGPGQPVGVWRSVRVLLVADGPSLGPPSTQNAPEEHRAVLAGHAVVVAAHVTRNPAPHARLSPWRNYETRGSRQGQCQDEIVATAR